MESSWRLNLRRGRLGSDGALVSPQLLLGRGHDAGRLEAEMAQEFTRIFKALGFKYVTLDLEGFRSGSMNAILPVTTLQREPE